MHRPDGLNPYCKECRRVPLSERKKGRSQYRTVDGVTLKTCTVCGAWKIASPEFFSPRHGKLPGECKECARKKRGTRLRANRNDPKIINGVLSKPCTRCGVWKPADVEHFYPFKQGKRGLSPWCRDCRRDHAYQWALRSGNVKSHHDDPKETGGVVHRKCRTCGRWLPATAEHFQPQVGCKLGLRPTCRECIRARSQQYATAHKEKAVARVKAWIKQHRERHRQHALAVKARRRAAEGEFKADDIQRHFNKQKGKCYYCLVPLDQTYEVDHFVPLSKGGTHHPENIVLACKSCNRAKAAKDPFKFLEKMRLQAALAGSD